MKVAFGGTPEFARTALAAIIASGFDVPLVLTQPDRPSGRGQKLQPSPVKLLAQEHGIPVHQPVKLRDPDTHLPIKACQPDVLVIAAYGLILPQAVLDIPRLGCINIHASLLPRWRGAAPIQRAIEAGDDQTGVTIMRMEAGLDTGPMLLAEALPIVTEDTAGSLHDKLATLGGRLIVQALRNIDGMSAVPQPESGVTYANKIEKSEAQLDLRQPASELARRIRAFNPFPGAWADVGGTTIKFWHATAVAGAGEAGTVLQADATAIVIATGSGALHLTELQKPGGRRMSAADFLHGFPLAVGQKFSVPGSP